MPLNGVARRTPRHAKAALLQQQRQREAQIQALRREGIFIEDEYMDEIHRYMLEMEVRYSLMRLCPQGLSFLPLAVYHVFHSVNGPTTRD